VLTMSDPIVTSTFHDLIAHLDALKEALLSNANVDSNCDVDKAVNTVLASLNEFGLPGADDVDNPLAVDVGSGSDEANQEKITIETRGISGQRLEQESVAILRAVVDTAVDAIITIDEKGFIQSYNRSAEQMFGYTASEAVGQNVSMLMPNPFRHEHDQYLQNYLETREAKIIGIGREATGLRKNGTTFPIDLAVSEVHVEGRHLFAGIVREVTERNQLQREVLEISTHEQQRIGRDLHDGLGQDLTGIAFIMEAFQRELESRDKETAGRIHEIVSMINQTIDHTRALVRGLCPVDLDADGLSIALEQMADSINDIYRVDCKFTCFYALRIADYHVATNLYYIVHEAVHNAIRHGDPSRITIDLQLQDDDVVLIVEDDGKGLPEKTQKHGGRGLEIMAYRARVIGGSLHVTSERGKGTKVKCQFDRRMAASKKDNT
jgi:two-component system, LuxR family, sensor kinase FixL